MAALSREQAHVNGWLEELGSSINQKFHLDSQGVCTMDYKDELRISVEVPHGSDQFYVYGPLVDLSSVENQQQVLHKALSLNLFQLETAGGTLAIDELTSEIVFCFVSKVGNQGISIFQNILNNFVSTADRLRGLLKDASQPMAGGGNDKVATPAQGKSQHFMQV